jgi:serine/threonine protein kinase/Tol biopolymer transport system component
MGAALSPGAKLGRYEIRSQIGVGGMGEVYLALDTTLDRQVALKVLPEEVASNRQRMQRFVQEAKAASALNHPNIITIHEIGTQPGAHFMVTEFIEGENLRHHLRRAPLMLTEAIEIAVQVASALSSAHEAGIIHRDIKPENIMVRKDGIVKVLDFGLAKLTEQRRVHEVDQDAATQAMVQTEPGTVVGTTAYLSPEQARALDVDTRTDIWSLGVALYEMITRHAPFKGETPSDTSAAILKSEPPPISQFVPDVPAEIERIVRKALQKNREERYQGVKDLLLDLKSLRRDLDVSAAIERSGAMLSQEQRLSGASLPGLSAASRQSIAPIQHISTQASALSQQLGLTSGARWLWLATILLISGLALGGWFWWRQRATDANRFAALSVTQLVSRKNDLGAIGTIHARFSPDGKFVSYASTKGNSGAIWLKQIGSGEPFANQSELATAASPIWSPDGLQIAFLSKREEQNGIWTMAAFGGSPALVKTLESFSPELVAWSRDGKICFVMQGNLYSLNIATQEISAMTKFDSSKPQDRGFAISPNEERLAYTDSSDGQSDIWMVPTRGGPPVRITNDKAQDSHPVWTPDGQAIIYSSKRNGINQICLVRLGGSQPAQVTVNDSNSNVLDISPDGTKILYSTDRDESDLWSVKLDRSKESQLTSDAGVELWPDVAPDGETLAFQATRATTNANLFNCLILATSLKSAAAPTQLASDGFAPLWSPDGKQVAFLRSTNASNYLWLVHAGGGDAKPLTTGSVTFGGFSQLPYNRLQTQDFQWSPDSSHLIYCANTSGVTNVWQIGVDGSAPSQLSDNTDANVRLFNPTWSPDGQRVAWLARSTDQKQVSWSIWVIAEGQKKKVFQSDSMLGLVGWSQSGQELIVKSVPGKAGLAVSPVVSPVDVSLSALSVRDGKQRSVAQLPATYFQNIKLASAGNQIAFVTRQEGADSLQVIAANGGATKTILTSSDPRVYFSSIAWSPDGKTIYYGKQSSWTVFSMLENFK